MDKRELKAITEESGEHKAWMERAKKIKTVEELTEFVADLRDGYAHDYGTICHAIAAAAIGAAFCVERGPQGGITGFQASCIIWEIIGGWGVFGDGPKRMVSFSDLLYPQYEHRFTSITPDTWKWAQDEAKKLLSRKNAPAAERVQKHWESIASGAVPFGLAVVEQ